MLPKVEISKLPLALSSSSSLKPLDDFAWTLIEAYFYQDNDAMKQLVNHQIESYNYFIDVQLKDTIEMFNPTIIRPETEYDAQARAYMLEMELNFVNIHIKPPQIMELNGANGTDGVLLTPKIARLRNLNYASDLTLDLHIKIIVRKKENHLVFFLPGKEPEADLLEFLSHPKIEKKEKIKKLSARCGGIGVGESEAEWLVALNSHVHPLIQMKYAVSEQTYFNVLSDLKLGSLDIMVKSKLCVMNPTEECEFETGGYFIVKGSEKVVLAQECSAENRILCYHNKNDKAKRIWTAEIKSVPDNKCISPKQLILFVSDKTHRYRNAIYAEIPRILKPIPLFVLFRIFGNLSDKEICELICPGLEDTEMLEKLTDSIHMGAEYLTQESAHHYLSSNMNYFQNTGEKANKRQEYLLQLIKTDIFPHASHKKEFLGYMSNALLMRVLRRLPPHDRDANMNIQLASTGVLLNNLLRNYYNKLNKDMIKNVTKEIKVGCWRANQDYLSIINMRNIYKLLKPGSIDFHNALGTGNFGLKSTNSNKVGVAQVLNRLGPLSKFSHLRRTSKPIDKNGKLIQPRKLHNTSWGMVCPVETPEGHAVGIVKNISYMTHLTISSSSVAIFSTVAPHILGYDSVYEGTKIKVLVNGNWLGHAPHGAAWEFYQFLKEQKYQGYFSIYTSIVFDITKKEIRICNHAGRFCRPLLRVQKGKLLLQKEHLLRLESGEWRWKNLFFPDGLLEYLDAEEQSLAFIATTPNEITTRHTHCEIHCDTIFGVLAACVPFPDHNQSPRNTYQCAMSKQAIGMYATNYPDRMDTTSYVLNNYSRPLVCTRLMDILKLNQIAPGYNIHVAIMTHTGFNQEDSLILNQSSIDRGLFQATVYHTEKNEEKNQIHGDKQIRGIPPDFRLTKGLKKGANYSKLNDDFMLPENTKVEKNDVYLASYVQLKETKSSATSEKEYKYMNMSKTMNKINEEVYIDRNYQSKNGEGYPIHKVRTRALRVPGIGDKFSSRSGQKGICGLTLAERDMPFTADGQRPDLIINPHCMPSRMTEALLIEMMLCPILVELGLFGDGSAFQSKEFSVRFLMKILYEMGREQHGNQLMYDGKTGRAFECSVFMGIAFYQRLKHMVIEKIHSRATGPNVVYTRQPIDGRSRNGGLRVGEMERDAILAHGASAFIKDRMYDVSDKYQVVICKACGQIASYNEKCTIHNCHYCENHTDFALVKIPYSLKLMKQELDCLNVSMRFLTS